MNKIQKDIYQILEGAVVDVGMCPNCCDELIVREYKSGRTYKCHNKCGFEDASIEKKRGVDKI